MYSPFLSNLNINLYLKMETSVVASVSAYDQVMLVSVMDRIVICYENNI